MKKENYMVYDEFVVSSVAGIETAKDIVRAFSEPNDYEGFSQTDMDILTRVSNEKLDEYTITFDKEMQDEIKLISKKLTALNKDYSELTVLELITLSLENIYLDLDTIHDTINNKIERFKSK